jgi:hypothetical protein
MIFLTFDFKVKTQSTWSHPSEWTLLKLHFCMFEKVYVQSLTQIRNVFAC